MEAPSVLGKFSATLRSRDWAIAQSVDVVQVLEVDISLCLRIAAVRTFHRRPFYCKVGGIMHILYFTLITRNIDIWKSTVTH